MNEVGRLLLSLSVAAFALTLAGGGVIWFMGESRRLRRSFRRVLRGDPHALLIARGRGRGLGFNFATNQLAVGWDAGAWCLLYRIDELIGMELVVDGQVAARVFRGEARRPLDVMSGADTLVRLRLIFDDAAYPDFVLDLWLPEDETRRGAMTAPEAVQEANRWLARTESLFRRPVPRREAAAVARPASPPAGARPEPESDPEPAPFDPAPDPKGPATA